LPRWARRRAPPRRSLEVSDNHKELMKENANLLLVVFCSFRLPSRPALIISSNATTRHAAAQNSC